MSPHPSETSGHPHALKNFRAWMVTYPFQWNCSACHNFFGPLCVRQIFFIFPPFDLVQPAWTFHRVVVSFDINFGNLSTP